MSTQNTKFSNFFTERLNSIVEQRFNGNWAELSRETGIRGSTLQGIKEGGNARIDTLQRICETLKIPASELVGHPEIGATRRESNSLVELYKPAGVIQASNSHEELIEIPQLDVSFSTGHGSYPNDHTLAIGSRPFSGKWIRNKGLKPEHLALVRVHGDSMEPLLKDKDMVMLDQSVNTPITTMPIAFRLGGELYIKLCQSGGDGNLQMISVNKVYDPIIVDREKPPHDFAIIAAVVWHAHSWI